ncbi:alpha-glucan family phosphorylase [Candidatus Bathyarchaeota archaeon]|nr:MAG: alpha-glucan family phosphorylase [Candidatus Bathyarchaeota archaeon]
MSESRIVRDPVCGMPLELDKVRFKAEFGGKVYYFCSEYCKRRFFERPKIAYFSMEIGIKSEIPTYSGGLGVLAGDTIRSSADLRIPMIAVTLVSRKGYLKQRIMEDGEQLEYPDEWDPSEYIICLPQMVEVPIEGRRVKVRAWLYEYQSVTGGVVPILFLDTDVDGNSPEDRCVTDYLYGGDERYRLKQEIVLGIGGVRMLEALNINVAKYHMNEGHSSLLTLELLRKNGMNQDEVKNLCIFTTHTPVEAAFDKFPYKLIKEVLGEDFLPLETLKKYGGQEWLNMTLLALNLSKYTNGVTKAHMEYSRKLFPGHHIMAITNGVHSYTWTSPFFRKLFDKYIPGWANEPELLVRVEVIPDDELWEAHVKAKKHLLEFVHERAGVTMDSEILTIGFARRATAYKRATLIFSDLNRLREVNRTGKIQMIFAGKAHPKDIPGKMIIKEIYKYAKMLKDEIRIVYLENYSMDMAAKLTSGVDVWLNTPLPPLEASGTSGMKAAHNGVLNFSVLDGWWVEGCIEGVTGWAIGPHPDEIVSGDERRRRELRDLYNKLEYLIIPTFYERRDKWIDMMSNAIGKVAYYFNSHRMMQRYATEAYLL